MDIDFLAGGAQQADEGVAENRIAQVADVRGLVGIDAGVLYKRMQAAGFEFEAFTACNEAYAGGTVETRVDVTCAGDFKTGEAIERTESGGDFLGDDLVFEFEIVL